MNIFEPWILLRLLAGLTAAGLLLRAAMTAARVLGRFDARGVGERQLATERDMELATTFTRAGAVVQVGALALSVLAADRLSHSIRGVMCAYGVFSSDPLGFVALFVTAGVALFAAVTCQLCALDRRVRSLDLVRPIALAAVVLAPLALLDLATTATFFLRLDLGAMTSCCSVQLDPGAGSASSFASGSRAVAAWGAVAGIATMLALSPRIQRRPRSWVVVLAAAGSLAIVPFALDAAVLEVAPHAFELPQHTCPFCLLHADVFFLGYPLFGAIFLAATWSGGAGLAGLVARRPGVVEAFPAFARGRLRGVARAWVVALSLGVAPVAHHLIASGGRSLFP